MSFTGKYWEFPVRRIVKFIDGDSIRLLVDVGFRMYKEVDVRINGVDTPEIRGDNKHEGIRVANYVRALLETWEISDRYLLLVSLDLDKYGRVLGDVISACHDGTTESLAENLLENGFAKPYGGKKKQEWTAAELEHIRQTCPSGVI